MGGRRRSQRRPAPRGLPGPSAGAAAAGADRAVHGRRSVLPSDRQETTWPFGQARRPVPTATLVRQLSIFEHKRTLTMPTIDVLDSTMFYEQAGSGTPLVFLHGNPTSSYLWRHVLPRIGAPGRCLAPDLIGMGRSGKPDVAYRFSDHARYLDAWFDALDLEGVTLVGHDWGAALGFDWARRHSQRVAAVAFMETIVKPITWDEFHDLAAPVWQ